MVDRTETLPAEVPALHQLVVDGRAREAQLTQENRLLREQLALLKAGRFGRSSEAIPAEQLKSTFAIAPAHGTAGLESITAGLPDDMDQQLIDATAALLLAVDPEAVVFEFGNPRPVTQMKYKLAVKLHGASRRAVEDALPNAAHYATDTDGAVTLLSDGTTYSLHTQYADAVGEADAPTSLEIGW